MINPLKVRSASIMTFVWHVDCDADGTFARAAATRRPSAANKSSNCAVAMVASAHSLDSAMLADPCPCPSTHDQAIAAKLNAA